MAQKPTIPKGTRDFSPAEMLQREYITGIIRKTFKKYGFAPIETPSFENLSTLMGKYGEEGDRLIFKILNSGDFLASVDPEWLAAKQSNKVASKISEKALRYDLTVPFARYVVQHQSEISFPFKRYQIQPVWRADRPQKGRYREFCQCDADVVGSSSLLQEVELIQIYDEVFSCLKLPVTIKVNNRKILAAVAEVVGEPNKLVEITVALDKLDKIGCQGVEKEMVENGVSAQAIARLEPLLRFDPAQQDAFAVIGELIAGNPLGEKGIEELRFLFEQVAELGLESAKLEFDLTLARGLNYYTGAIFEVKASLADFTSSIGGGGRYDDLTGIFGMKGVSGVGISFGLDRIQLVLSEAGLFPDSLGCTTDVFFVNFGKQEVLYSLRAAMALRKAGRSAEVYPDAVKVGKQLDYANRRGIRYVAMAGSDEINRGVFTLKDMQTGQQQIVLQQQLIEKTVR